MIQDAVSELNEQLQQHPSLLPGDFDISLAGDLVLGTPSSPAHFTSSNLVTPPELDDQCVPQTSPLSSTEQVFSLHSLSYLSISLWSTQSSLEWYALPKCIWSN